MRVRRSLYKVLAIAIHRDFIIINPFQFLNLKNF